MNGYGSQRRLTATTFSVIQTITMIVWTARKRPVPRKRAIVSANAPTASGLSRRKLPNRRVWPRGTSSRGASATTGPLAPVVRQQVVEDVVDAHGADQGRRWFAEQPLDVCQAQVAAGGRGRGRPADVHLAGQGRRQLRLAHAG